MISVKIFNNPNNVRAIVVEVSSLIIQQHTFN